MLRTLTKIPALISRLPSRALFLCLVTAGLLILSFPKHDAYPLCWFALIPFFFAVERRPWRQSFWLGYFTGAAVYLGTVTWFINMAPTAEVPLFLSVAAFIGMVVYLSVYYGIFAAVYALFSKRNNALLMMSLPCLWVVLEWVRDHLFSGFGWLSLGYSQYKFLSLIQIADMTGVLGISFLLVLSNTALKECLGAFRKTDKSRFAFIPLIIAVILLAGTAFYGKKILRAPDRQGKRIQIAVVQGNIDQKKKWRPWNWPAIINKYFHLTDEALAAKPDLIIWPETAFPGFLWDYPKEMYEDVQRFVRERQIPLLMGAVLQEKEKYYNMALLLNSAGEVNARYDKMHLVPFGEYLPLRDALPFLKSLIPIADFQKGKTATQFPVVLGARRETGHFSVLICFEDTVARMARRMVNAGAELLINLTNDAWFLDSKEPYLHLQAAVFRAVENRRDLIRAANTGISCVISSKGRIRSVLKAPDGDATYIEGYLNAFADLNQKKTFYTRHGDVFILVCAAFFIFGVMYVQIKK